jgi:uncharacterized protein (TIGR03382 family)
MRKLVMLGAALATTPVYSASFLNGGFEDGTTSGWTVGGGSRASVNNPTLTASQLLPGGSLFNGASQISITNPGFDSNLGGTLLPTVFPVTGGAHSLRVGDLITGGFAGAVTQTVFNYTAPTLNFAWAAVLEPAHTVNDAPIFRVAVRDVTANTTIYSVTFAAFPGSPNQNLFLASGNLVYAPWQNVTVNTVVGNTYAIDLLAADCQPTGHFGYAYLDGFGSVAGGGGDNGNTGGDVPLPGTLALLGVGAALLGLRRKA